MADGDSDSAETAEPSAETRPLSEFQTVDDAHEQGQPQQEDAAARLVEEAPFEMDHGEGDL